MGVSLAGKICTRVFAEPVQELKNTLISADVFQIFGWIQKLVIDPF